MRLKILVRNFDMLTNVRVAVKRATKNRQAPEFSSALDGKFCFVAPCGQTSPSLAVSPPVISQTAPVRVDRDRDGVVDSEDKCPNNTIRRLKRRDEWDALVLS
ncbi:MAG: hypothetical protein ABFS56_10885 [Pseudomonadota bacterium]